jgi:hypothetical protein
VPQNCSGINRILDIHGIFTSFAGLLHAFQLTFKSGSTLKITLTAEEIEPAESELAPRVGSIAAATLHRQASETHLDCPPITVNDDVLRSANGERTLESLLAEDGNLSAYDALRVLLDVCNALRSARKSGLHCSDLTPEQIIVDSDGRISLIGSKGRVGPNEDYIGALAAVFCRMVIGKIPTRRTEYDELDARLSRRLRRIIHRANSLDTMSRYARLADFVRDLRREERVQFYQAFTVLVVLLVTLLLFAQHPR